MRVIEMLNEVFQVYCFFNTIFLVECTIYSILKFNNANVHCTGFSIFLILFQILYNKWNFFYELELHSTGAQSLRNEDWAPVL